MTKVHGITTKVHGITTKIQEVDWHAVIYQWLGAD